MNEFYVTIKIFKSVAAKILLKFIETSCNGRRAFLNVVFSVF